MSPVNSTVLDKELLHPSSLKALQGYLSSPWQVLTIIGEEGAGKFHTGQLVAAELLSAKPEKLANETRLILLEKEEDKQEITIDAIRQMIRSLRVKPGRGQNRVIIIKDAHLLSPEAQNALLKTLEQPNPHTYFILTLASPSQILPTVLSRGQKLILHPVGLDQAKSYFKDSRNDADIERAWRLSEGLAGTLNALLSDEGQELRASVDLAKRFLAMTRYERLIEADKISKDKVQSALLIDGLDRTLKALHHSSIEKGLAGSRLLEARKLIQESKNYLKANTAPKLVLLNLVMNLRV